MFRAFIRFCGLMVEYNYEVKTHYHDERRGGVVEKPKWRSIKSVHNKLYHIYKEELRREDFTIYFEKL